MFKKWKIEQQKQIQHKSTKNGMFFGNAILKAFWEGSGKPKSLDFRIFYEVFSKQISNIILEAPKIKGKSPKKEHTEKFGSNLRNVRPAGERKRKGSKAS